MKTQYPILLVHGIALKDFFLFRSFGQIEKHLKDKGYDVYIGQNDAFGTIENNALQLKNQILDILLNLGTDKINIIAHSKGGLDAKYMIMHLGMEDHVASLTTLCTPHKGSIVATKIKGLPNWMKKYVAWNVNTAYKMIGDKNPNSLEVCNQLSQNPELDLFDKKMSTKVYCQSYSTTMQRGRNDIILVIPYKISKKYEDDFTDGLVSEKSSKFGFYMGNAFDESISHTEIVGFMTTKRKNEKVKAFYEKLCQDLAKRGF